LNATHQARETLELFHRLGIDDDSKLARYEQHVRKCELAERQILSDMLAMAAPITRAQLEAVPLRSGRGIDRAELPAERRLRAGAAGVRDLLSVGDAAPRTPLVPARGGARGQR
jgi:hypothetical protein